MPNETARRTQPTGNPVRLGSLIRDGKLLWCYCADCGHERDIDPASLSLSPKTPVPDLKTRMRCSACSSRKVDVRPELYPDGIDAMRAKWR